MAQGIEEGQAIRRTFRGFGTAVELRIYPDPGQGAWGLATLVRSVSWLRRAEATLSRFDPTSELSRINRSAGQPIRLSRLTNAVIAAAVAAARATGGLFDPTIEPALRAAGYGVTFDRIPRHSLQAFDGQDSRATWRDICFDNVTRTLWLPPGVGLDLGGIAKGWLADRVLCRLARHGRALVDIGGDIALTHAPTPGYWEVEVVSPFNPTAALGALRVTRGGIATSGVTNRSWRTEQGEQHHIIDPRTRRPARSDLASVSVVAASACAAEVAATATLLLGLESASRAIERSGGITAVLTPFGGAPVLAGGAGCRVTCWEANE